MPQNTNLNISPYFDDFDKDKNFYRVLYRPGFPIQARELTTMQSILQNQIESMGQHFFKEGAMVIPGQVGYDLNVQAVILQQAFLGVDVETYRTQLNGKIISGLTSGIRAKVLYSISAAESSKGYVTLYVKYIDSGDTVSATNVKGFQENEQLICDSELTFGTTLIEVGSPFAQLLPVNATAVAATAYVNNGVYFIRGHFINVPSSYIILDQYTNNPSYRIGLEVSESIVTPEDDPTLNDNAAGTSNYSAPGSHRFKISTQLVKKPIEDETDKNFIELVRIRDSKIEQFVNDTAYSVLEKSLARRTYEESGDYVIDTFDVKLREHRNDGFNNGVYGPGQVSRDGQSASEEYAAIEVSPGKAYIRGYRTEFLTPQYVDIKKPRDFTGVNNSIVPIEWGQYMKVYDVYGWPDITGEGVSDAYQVLDLHDGWTLNGGSTVTGQKIGRCRCVQLQKSATGIWDLYVMDVQMFTALNFDAGNSPVSPGDLLVGRISGARGFATTDISATYVGLEQVSGIFTDGEVITKDGRVVGTINAVFSYQLTDARSAVGYNSNSAVSFVANLLLNDAQAVRGSTITVDQSGAIITGLNGSKFEEDLRPGDVLSPDGESGFEGDTSLIVKKITKSTINHTSGNNVGGAPVFDYQAQTALLDTGLTKGSITDGNYTTVVRYRPFVFNTTQPSGQLSVDLPRESMKSLSDESFFVYRTFTNKTVVAGGLTVALPESEQFASLDDENYQLTILAQSGSSYAVGDNLDLEALDEAGTLTVTFGADRQSMTIDGLTGVTTVKLTALVSKNIVSRKIKTASKMRALKVTRTSKNNDIQKYGLLYGNLYGTRIEDQEISFGLNDVFKIHAVYESETDGAPQIPYSVLSEAVFFAPGTVITGETSGARATVVSFINATLRLYNVNLNNIEFNPGERIIGEDSDGNVLRATIDDADGSVVKGSKVVTDLFDLNSGQTPFFYNVSKLVRQPGVTPPTRQLMIVFDYFIHEASGDYFSAQSYTGIDFDEIPAPILQGSTKNVRDQIDFRPAVGELATGNGTVTGPFEVTCATLDFDARVFSTTNQGAGNAAVATLFDIPKAETEFRCDYEYYLPRTDKLFLTHDNKLRLQYGISAENPEEPENIQNAMCLAIFKHKPYMYDPQRDTIITQEVIRRYTMKDIGDLEKRINNVEYYTALSLLEVQTDATRSYDENGFDRLKNGFVVDDFTDHKIGDVNSGDYKCSLDFQEGILRPSHYTSNVPLQINTQKSQNIVVTPANIAMLPYENVVVVKQPYASRSENVNPFNVFTFIGRIDLTPSSDDWLETNRLPARVENVEGDFSSVSRELNIDPNTGFAPIQWGGWRTNWSSESLVSTDRIINRSGSTSGGGGWVGTRGRGLEFIHDRRTFQVRSNQSRQGIRTRVVPRIERRSMGDSILSQTAVPWIRSRNLAFDVYRMKPRSRIYCFFDGVDVSAYITPKVIELNKSGTNSNVARDVIAPNSDGNSIPATTIPPDPTIDNSNQIPFVVGETVIGTESKVRLKVASADDGYVTNPYGQGTETLPSSYASNTPYLNVDINGMAATANGTYQGNVKIGELLVGLTSGAAAYVKDRRLLTDNVGNFKGTFFIPSPKIDSNPRWATGTRTVRFTTNAQNSRIAGAVDSSADTEYRATGILQTVRENILAVRNAEIVRDTVNDERTIVTGTRAETRQIGWYDPLAQSFIVDEEGGIFITGVDIFFRTRDDNIPISMQIRTMENGNPTKDILPLSDITINAQDVEISESAEIPTRFEFRSPVYIKQSIEYCFVLLSDSNEYQVWISRMGDIEKSGNRTISEQPYAGVLFKSQNASTWTADQYEDLKFTIYKANFTSPTGTVTLDNVSMGETNGGFTTLKNNPLVTIQPEQVLSLPAGTNNSYTIGARLKQSPSNAEGTVVAFDSTTDPETITLTDIQGTWSAGFLDGNGDAFQGIISSQSTAIFQLSTVSNGDFSPRPGAPGGATIEVDIIAGSTSNATATVTAFYQTGDTLPDGNPAANPVLYVNYVDKAFDLSDTISENGGVVTATITSIAYSGDTYNQFPTAAPSYQNKDRKVLVYHKNHCMHQRTNNVEISGVVSEVPPTTLTSSLSAGATSINVETAGGFHTFVNGASIGNLNPGYLIIGNEIIQYSTISSNGQVITVATSGRGANGTADVDHPTGATVFCYNFDGIPLTEINKVHSSIDDPWLDHYLLNTTSVATNGIRGGGGNVLASQNFQFETLRPSIATMIFPETSMSARVNTTTATSVGDGTSVIDQASFVNNGQYYDITLNVENYFVTPQMVCSQVNESNKLGGNKSISLDIALETENTNLSPYVDLDRTSLICVSNRINSWPGGPQSLGINSLIDTQSDVSLLPVGDQNDAVYLTRIANLSQLSRTLKIDFGAYRPQGVEIRVYIKAFESGADVDVETVNWIEVFPIAEISASDVFEFRDYTYEKTGLSFNSFQVKIVMKSRNQAIVPQMMDFRSIALAT